MKRLFFGAVICILLAFLLRFIQTRIWVVGQENCRTWTAGQYKVKGEFEGVEAEGQIVRLKLSNGKSVRVKKSLLSQTDQEYVDNFHNVFEPVEEESIDVSTSEHKAGDRMVKTINGVEFAFRWCPAGTFMMGSPESEKGRKNDEIQHKVTLTKGFWMMETEVTQKQWKAIMGISIQHQANLLGTWGYDLYGEGDNYPMYYISWKDCQAFCQKCTDLGLPMCLPTEAQWEYACRAGSKTAYFWGNSLNGDKANCDGNYPYCTTTKGPYLEKTIPVKRYSPNAWGLYDMHGNVWEWCEDWYGEKNYGNDATDPVETKPYKFCRVFRGGGWLNSARYCRSARRDSEFPQARGNLLGFRAVLKGQFDEQTSSAEDVALVPEAVPASETIPVPPESVSESVSEVTSVVIEPIAKGSYAGERMVKTVNGVEFAFRYCPAGTFAMGSPTFEKNTLIMKHNIVLR